MKRDIKREITDRIIEAIENGDTNVTKRWTSTLVRSGMPYNITTGKAYSGGNVIMLLTSMDGYEHNAWITYQQAKDLGAQVRKGEKGVGLVHYNIHEKEDENGNIQKIPFAKAFTVFNIAQVDNLPERLAPKLPEGVFVPEQFTALVDYLKVDVRDGGDKAYYSASGDYIGMPRHAQFNSHELYVATLSHELIHWTGAPTRLNRTIVSIWGSEEYAFEELVAELGSAFICGHLRIEEQTIQGNAGYIEAWLQILKNDKNAIFRAAKLAGEAFDYLLSALDASLLKQAA